MDKYEELKGIIAEFVLRDEVVEDEETISAYNLFVLMVTKFNDLVYAYEYAPKKICDMANEALKKKYGLGRGFKKNKNDIMLYERVMPFLNLEESKMSMLFWSDDNGRDKASRVSKDIGEANLYYDYNDRVDDCVLDACVDEIYMAFYIFEEFYELFKDAGVVKTLEREDAVSLIFSFEDFDYKLKYSKHGKISANLSFNKDIDPKRVQNRQWYGDRLPISNYIEEYGDEILKRFPIKVSELDIVAQSIVWDYLKSKGKQKTMQ